MEARSRVELVSLEKPNGMTSYSLVYTPPINLPGGRKISSEDLNIESYTSPCNDIERRFNSQVRQIAEEIRCFRYVQHVNHDYSFLALNKEMDVILYMHENEPYRDKKCHAAIRSFKLFCKGHCKFDQLTVGFLMGYRSFLLKDMKAGKKQRYSHNTASSYLKEIKIILRLAYRENLINFDPVEEIPGISWDHTIRKERLDDNEIELIRAVDFKYKEVQKAVLFSIYTGLRRSDVLAFRWENIEFDKDTGAAYFNITIQKTGTPVRLPLAQDALRILGPLEKKGRVFPTLSESILNNRVKQLIEAAGIDKHITFHCFRHTYAMRLLDRGADIPTIAHMLGHRFMGSSLAYLSYSKSNLEMVISGFE